MGTSPIQAIQYIDTRNTHWTDWMRLKLTPTGSALLGLRDRWIRTRFRDEERFTITHEAVDNYLDEEFGRKAEQANGQGLEAAQGEGGNGAGGEHGQDTGKHDSLGGPEQGGAPGDQEQGEARGNAPALEGS